MLEVKLVTGFGYEFSSSAIRLLQAKIPMFEYSTVQYAVHVSRVSIRAFDVSFIERSLYSMYSKLLHPHA